MATATSVTVGSLVWVYYYDRMGFFETMEAIFNDYRNQKEFEIKFMDDGLGDLIEGAFKERKLGDIPSPVELQSCYNVVLGWNETGNDPSNAAPNQTRLAGYRLHTVISEVLKYIAKNDLTLNIREAATGPQLAAGEEERATNAVRDLKQSFRAFNRGNSRIITARAMNTITNYQLIFELVAKQVGVPAEFLGDQHLLVPALYNLFVQRQPIVPEVPNRYTLNSTLGELGEFICNEALGTDPDDLDFEGTGKSAIFYFLEKVQKNAADYNEKFKIATGSDLNQLSSRLPEPLEARGV